MIMFSSVYQAIEAIHMLVNPDHAIDRCGSLIHRMLGRSYARVASMSGHFTQTASSAVIAQQFDVAVPPLFTPRYYIAASRTRWNGRGPGNYAGPAVVPTLNRIGQNHEASSI